MSSRRRPAAALLHLELRLPEALDAGMTDRPDVQHMPRRDGMNLAEDGARAKHMAEAEEIVHAALID